MSLPSLSRPIPEEESDSGFHTASEEEDLPPYSISPPSLSDPIPREEGDSGFHTVFVEKGPLSRNPFLQRETVFTDLCPIPTYVGTLVGGFQPQEDVNNFLQGADMGYQNRTLSIFADPASADRMKQNRTFCAISNINEVVRNDLQTACTALELDCEDTKVQIGLINCLICWSHATAKLDMGELTDDYRNMQQKMGTDHGDTLSRLETLFKAALPEDEYRDHFADVCTFTRMRYLTEHEELNLQGLSGIMGHDLQPKRWTAAKVFLNDFDLDTKCPNIPDLEPTISPETKVSEDNEAAESKPRGLRESCRSFKKRLLRSRKGSAPASGSSK